MKRYHNLSKVKFLDLENKTIRQVIEVETREEEVELEDIKDL